MIAAPAQVINTKSAMMRGMSCSASKIMEEFLAIFLKPPSQNVLQPPAIGLGETVDCQCRAILTYFIRISFRVNFS